MNGKLQSSINTLVKSSIPADVCGCMDNGGQEVRGLGPWRKKQGPERTCPALVEELAAGGVGGSHYLLLPHLREQRIAASSAGFHMCQAGVS